MMKINPDPLTYDPAAEMQIGPYSVELIQLCRFRMDGGAFFGVVPKKLWMKAYPHVDETNRIELVGQSLLVRGNGIVMVVDAGLGDKLNDKTKDAYAVDQQERMLPRALEARGIAVEDVTHFVFTHLHFDHCGGATEVGPDGKLRPVFPNAVHLVQAGQLAWANNPSDKDKATFDPQNWEAVNDAGKLRELEGDFSPAPGIELRVVHGHTTGMQLVLIRDADKGFLFGVDLFMTSAQLHPHYVPSLDNHPLATVDEKRIYLEEIHAHGWYLGFAHDPFTPPSKVTRDERGRWVLA